MNWIFLVLISNGKGLKATEREGEREREIELWMERLRDKHRDEHEHKGKNVTKVTNISSKKLSFLLQNAFLIGTRELEINM